MYAHVTTYRLSESSEFISELEHARKTGEIISDQTARTLASYWHSPTKSCEAITALSHGRPFDTEVLRDQIMGEISNLDDRFALIDWLDQLEALLSE